VAVKNKKKSSTIRNKCSESENGGRMENVLEVSGTGSGLQEKVEKAVGRMTQQEEEEMESHCIVHPLESTRATERPYQ